MVYVLLCPCEWSVLTLVAYPPDAIIGPTLLDIPAEELFFFVIQTYIVSTLHH